METTRTETGLRYVRWMLNSVPPPTYAKAAGFTGRVDRWQDFEFKAPSHIVQWSGALDVGKGAQESETREGGFSLRILHSLTPETETTCHYFWSTANGYRQDDPAATEQLYSEIAAAFLEDQAVVAQQQARLSELGEADVVDIVSDAARIHMRRVLDRMALQDQHPAQHAAE
jgi:vanillate O-demethylase monooxygenase subunit